jgi:hypothetical protein
VNKVLLILLVLGLGFPVFSADYGVIITQQIDGDDGDRAYTGTAAPWISLPLGEETELYLSAGLGLYYQGGDWTALPELHRFAFQFRPAQGVLLEAGRLRYRDIRGAAASGLFDGFALSLNPGGLRFSVRVLYTGLQYKDSADIVMTGEDRTAYAKKVSYDNGGVFAQTYFASRRIIGAVSLELPESEGPERQLVFEGMGQADINGGKEQLHSAYLSARFNGALKTGLNLELGGTAAMVKETGAGPSLALSASGGLDWEPPEGVPDRLALLVRYTSGKAGKVLGAFPGITLIPQGYVLNGSPEGLALIEGTYRARLGQSLSWELGAAYFFRTGDSAALNAFGAAAGDKNAPFLGAEFRTSFVWVPFSDLSFSLDGGFFIPQWGNYLSGSSLPWRITGGLIFSF